MGQSRPCTCLVRQGAPGASAVRHREPGKCAKTEIYDLSILMKEDGVLGFWGIELTHTKDIIELGTGT